MLLILIIWTTFLHFFLKKKQLNVQETKTKTEAGVSGGRWVNPYPFNWNHLIMRFLEIIHLTICSLLSRDHLCHNHVSHPHSVSAGQNCLDMWSHSPSVNITYLVPRAHNSVMCSCLYFKVYLLRQKVGPTCWYY